MSSPAIDESAVRLLEDPEGLQRHILDMLGDPPRCPGVAEGAGAAATDDLVSSSVLVLLGCSLQQGGHEREPCLILNRRSRKVKQAGDLCCPGGTTEQGVDPILARLLSLPGFPLSRWPHWRRWKRTCSEEAGELALHLATCLRESWEEMRLNPLRVRFLGALPPERLVLFPRLIHPLVGWIEERHRLKPNWEVTRIVSIPLRSLLDPSAYTRYRLYVDPQVAAKVSWTTQDFLCFLYQDGVDVEVLWGATLRIVLLFLEKIFGFTPPDVSSRPFVPGILDEAYLNGRL